MKAASLKIISRFNQWLRIMTTSRYWFFIRNGISCPWLSTLVPFAFSTWRRRWPVDVGFRGGGKVKVGHRKIRKKQELVLLHN